MTRDVIFSPEARQDLVQLFHYVAERAGARRALGYIERIEAYCSGLAIFPERGTRQDDLWSGLRTIGFERRVTIAFTVTPKIVTILRILYGGRDLEAALRQGSP